MLVNWFDDGLQIKMVNCTFELWWFDDMQQPLLNWQLHQIPTIGGGDTAANHICKTSIVMTVMIVEPTGYRADLALAFSSFLLQKRTGFWSQEIGFQSQKKVQNSPGPSLGPTCQVDDGMVHFWDRYYIRRYQNIHTLFCPITSLSPEKVQITTPKTKLIVFDVAAMDKLLKIICKGKRRSKMLGFVPPLVGRRTMGDICINSPDMTTAPIVPLPTIYRLLLRCLVTHNKSTVYNHYM